MNEPNEEYRTIRLTLEELHWLHHQMRRNVYSSVAGSIAKRAAAWEFEFRRREKNADTA